MEIIDVKQYNKALKVIKDYPEALNIINQYNRQSLKNESTHIDLRGILNARACNVIKQYFADNFKFRNLKFEIWNFPIEYISKIDMDKILTIKNCGRNTYNLIIDELIVKYNPK